MKRLLSALSLLVLVQALAGCAWFTKPEPEIRRRTVLLTLPDYFVEDCEVQLPPDPNAYVLFKDWDKKEKMLTDALSASISKAVACNLRMKNARDWQTKQITFANSLDTPEPEKK